MMIHAEGQTVNRTFQKILRLTARAISYVFHPLFVPVYAGIFFIYVARLFPGLDAWKKDLLLIQFAVNYTLLPLVTLLLAKGLGFIQSIYLKTSKDRIIPYVATGVFYFWIWYVFKNQHFPKEVVMFSLAVFLSSSLGLILNSYVKVSMHAISMGVITTLMIILGFSTYLNYGPYIAITLLIAGLVCSSRLILSDHTQKEIYVGFVAGAGAQLVAMFFV